MSDVAVTFGGDTGELEAASAQANAHVRALTREVNALAAEMEKAGTSADASLGAKLKTLGAELAEAKKHAGELRHELSLAGKEGEGGNALEALAKSLKSSLGPLQEFRAGLGEIAEIIAVAFAVEKIVEFTRSMGELAEKNETIQKTLGLTAKKQQELAFDAKMAGVQNDEVTAGLVRFELSLAKAATGLGPAAAGLRVLGLNAKELTGIPVDEQLKKIADAVARLEDGPNKIAALEAINKAFPRLLTLLDEGSAKFDEYNKILAETNSTMDQTTQDKLNAMNNAFKVLDQSISGVALQTFKPFIQAVQGGVMVVTDLMQAISSLVKENDLVRTSLVLLGHEFQGLGVVLEFAIAVLKSFDDTMNGVVMSSIALIKGLAGTFAEVFNAILDGAARFGAALLTALTEPLKLAAREALAFGNVMSMAMNLDFAGAKAAYASMGEEASKSGAKIKGAFAHSFDMSGVGESARKGADEAAEIWTKTGEKIVGSFKHADEQSRIIVNGQAEHTEETSKKVAAALDLDHDRRAKAGDKAARDATAAAIEAAQNEIRAVQESTKEQILAIDGLARRHEISEAQKVAATIAALDKELDAETDIVDKELQLHGLSLKQRQAILNEGEKLARDNSLAIQKIQQEAADKTAASWKSVADTMAGLIDGQVNGVLRGTTSIAQAFKNMAASAIEDIIKYTVKWAAEHAATMALNLSGLAAGTAAEKAIKSQAISGDAGRAGAGAYAALAGIPIIGPIIAPAAAAVAFAGVEAFGSFDIGSWSLPSDMFAKVHAGEMIVPAAQTPWAQSLMANAAGGAGQGGGHTFNSHLHVSGGGLDPREFEKHAAVLARVVHGQFKQERNYRNAPAFAR